MKILRFSYQDKIKYGILDGDTIRALAGKPFRGIKKTAEYYPSRQARLLAPVLPSKIVALGLNYLGHAKEFNQKIPEVPLIFLKPSTAVIGPGDDIVYPSLSKQVDYEAELGVVIGKTAYRVPQEKSLDYVFGYTCVNDVTARDQQSRDGQWTRAKGYNTFAPLGPHIETGLDPSDVLVESYLNGQRKQHASTVDLAFKVPELISFISNIMTLLPGDVIATGTPDGVGPMQVGDTIEIKITGIGTLTNRVVAPK
jgi:2-keto-4-pentenoate hydratase/2-oxohepta-3-ene-1,7-dioic acid hydratase in catechol pathway